MSTYYDADGNKYNRSWQVVVYHQDGHNESPETYGSRGEAEARADDLADYFEREGLDHRVGVEELPAEVAQG